MNNFKELKVWDKSMHLVKEIYKSTSSFPKEEIYGLTNQIRRCSVSIPSNIAEGSGRTSKNEFHHFLSIALGSSFELETQSILGRELQYLSEENFNILHTQIIEIQKMIRGLQKSLG